MHRLLQRQLRKVGIGEERTPDLDEWQRLLGAVEGVYQQVDQERYLTERSTMLASEELRRLHTNAVAQSSLLDATLGSLDDGVLALDSSGRIAWANPVVTRMLELEGAPKDRHLSDIVDYVRTVDEDAALADMVMARSAQQEHDRFDCVTHPRSGERKHLSVSYRPLDASQSAEAVGTSALAGVLVLRDVTDAVLAETERAELENQLARSHRMEAVGQLAGGVAHDFNNILATIMGCAELLLDDVEGQSAADVDEIRRAARRGAELTSELMTFSRTEHQDPELVDQSSVVMSLLPLLERTLGASIEIESRLTDEPTPVLIDPAELDQVLLNLALNARDAMATGGRLIIETRIESVVEDRQIPCFPDLPSGRLACLVVTDEGCGMDAETVSRVFEPFFTTKDVGEGSGLGLSTAYGSISNAGGQITVYSEPGAGTTVRVYLPLQETTTEDPDEPPVDAEDVGRARRILLVEDEDILRRTTQRLLERQGYEVTATANGQEALAAVDDAGFDLLISDVMMPGKMLGTELAERIRIQRPDMAVLLMSGYPGAALNGTSVIDDIKLLEKPFTSDSLYEMVSSQLHSVASGS